jgi:hypothetical protein
MKYILHQHSKIQFNISQLFSLVFSYTFALQTSLSKKIHNVLKTETC